MIKLHEIVMRTVLCVRSNMLQSFALEIGEPLLVVNPSNIFYFTGYIADYAYLLINGGKIYYLSDSRFTIEAKNKLPSFIEFVEISQTNLTNTIKKIIGSARKLNIDKDMSYYEYKKLSDNLDGITLYDINSEITALRSVKTAEEINKIKGAQKIAETALDRITPFIKVGVTERELKYRLEYEMGTAGSEKTAFDTIVAFGENSACAHAKPSDRILKSGDIVLIDFGATYKGYRSDMTRTFVYGYVGEKLRNIYEAVLNAQLAALSAIEENALINDVDAAARNSLISSGYGDYFTHSTGHGVGIDIHEAPAVNKNNMSRLSKGAVITVEPGVYIDGLGGIRIEDMYAVGYGNLTNYGKTLTVLK